MKYDHILTETFLKDFYSNKNYSINRISLFTNINRTTIKQYFIRYKIKLRKSNKWTKESKEKISGKGNSFYNKTHSLKNKNIFRNTAKRRINKLNPRWKGDNVSYRGLHLWITKNYGKADRCENVNCKNKTLRFEWSNVSGNYKRDRADWQMLCKSCHRIYDNNMRKAIFGVCK